VGDFRGQSIRSIYPASGPSQLPPLIVPKTILKTSHFFTTTTTKKQATKQTTNQTTSEKIHDFRRCGKLRTPEKDDVSAGDEDDRVSLMYKNVALDIPDAAKSVLQNRTLGIKPSKVSSLVLSSMLQTMFFDRTALAEFSNF
jgi:hypothetical protein